MAILSGEDHSRRGGVAILSGEDHSRRGGVAIFQVRTILGGHYFR